jgi:hypothetical protein
MFANSPINPAADLVSRSTIQKSPSASPLQVGMIKCIFWLLLLGASRIHIEILRRMVIRGATLIDGSDGCSISLRKLIGNDDC